MKHDTSSALPFEHFPRDLRATLALIGGAALVGALTGCVGVAFITCLQRGADARTALHGALAHWPAGLGALTFTLVAAALAGLATWLVVRFAPTASGSGVPYVERILRGTEVPRHRHVLPVKFFGGLLALSSGLVLGREGPMVQMGAVIGERLGRWFPSLAWKPLMEAGAGAGLASAFNAPVSGTVFILEEVFRRVTPVSFILATTATTSAVFVQRAFFGAQQDYHLLSPQPPAIGLLFVFVLFGAGIGALGALYNRLILATLALGDRCAHVPAPLRAATVGGLAGLVGWFLPDWMGGGDDITQRVLLAAPGLGVLLTMAAMRFVLGPLSYAAGTPGGLFAPVVTLGALFGAATGLVAEAIAPGVLPGPVPFAVVGMAAFFTATVRAPMTGIALCLEMTGSFHLFFPLLATCLGAYLVPTLLGNAPIYDALADRRPRFSRGAP